MTSRADTHNTIYAKTKRGHQARREPPKKNAPYNYNANVILFNKTSEGDNYCRPTCLKELLKTSSPRSDEPIDASYSMHGI